MSIEQMAAAVIVSFIIDFNIRVPLFKGLFI